MTTEVADDVDFEPEEDAEEDVDMAEGAPEAQPASSKSLRSQVERDSAGRKIKGRGAQHQAAMDAEMRDRYSGRAGVFDSIGDGASGPGPQRSIEGWIVSVSGVHEEATEDDIIDKFSEFGEIKNLHLNLDRRTGFVKGYCFIEYEHFKEAQAAIQEMNGATLLESPITADWAFSKGPIRRKTTARRRATSPRRRRRSVSPDRRRNR